jgi:hypothetical protein
MSRQYKKHSLGTLRQAARTKDKSPSLIGQIALQRSDIIAIHRHLQEMGRDEVICNIAGWFYEDSQGKCITVQISPPYGKRPVVASTLEAFFEESDEDDDIPS